MANLSKDIQCVGYDTRPPMLDRTDFALWQQRIRLYCRGKKNGVNILKYNADIQATHILLQGLPKDIYSLINHYPDEKDIWDNVKMLLGGLKLTKDDRKSQLMQLDSKFINNILPEWGKLVTAVKLNRGLLQLRSVVCLSEAARDNVVDEDMDEQPVQDLTLNVDNVFQADDCDAFDSDVDKAHTAYTMFMANLSSANPVYDEAGLSYDSNILSEVHDYDNYQDTVCEHHEVHEMHDDVQPNYDVDLHADYTSDNNMILYDQYVKDNNNVVDKSLTAELATYKEQVELYERRARFELTKREQKIDEQLRIVITEHNIKEENLKTELHSVKMQLASTINHNKSMTTTLLTENENLKVQINAKLKCITLDFVTPKVLAPGCSKHMIGDRSQLGNFINKFIGTVRFGNDHFGAIMRYGDYVIGDSVISRVYYMEGLGHNLFFVEKFCDFDLPRHDEVLPNLLVFQSLQDQIMVVASSFKPLELRYHQ
uniref:Integrase, catalytic region, zinc finger, CCHC-type, peptidase aspartic, catalytic n=1 Tax=Tanacetum cinerariifolium TaxID=118510 RepID=A0A6L2K518_TANCI|nr:integrase, catalytic region, zinc finger, CCHC-type, peptidase aspartic, catalytic [Tanacetum cinerariifolium]